MRRTSSAASFRPQLESLESREAPASASSSAFGNLGNLFGGNLTNLLPINSAISEMQKQNSKLTTDQQTLVTSINSGATSQTIAGDFGRASSDFGKVQSLNTQVQNLVHTGELALLGLSLAAQGQLRNVPAIQNVLTTLGLQNLLGGQTHKSSSNNDNDNDDNNNNHQGAQAVMQRLQSRLTTVSLAGLFLLNQQSQQANNILSSATTTANMALPGGFPTIASVS
jgi:hypothetical protein